MCCSALEIDYFKKPAGPLCVNCHVGSGCGIYAQRPQVCRDFECEWLSRRDLPRQLRPDLVGTILMEDADSDEYRAGTDPAERQQRGVEVGLGLIELAGAQRGGGSPVVP